MKNDLLITFQQNVEGVEETLPEVVLAKAWTIVDRQFVYGTVVAFKLFDRVVLLGLCMSELGYCVATFGIRLRCIAFTLHALLVVLPRPYITRYICRTARRASWLRFNENVVDVTSVLPGARTSCPGA